MTVDSVAIVFVHYRLNKKNIKNRVEIVRILVYSTYIVVCIVLGNNIDHNILTMFTYIEPSTLRLFMHI